jgi:alpha-1,6-mannosyltransferase
MTLPSSRRKLTALAGLFAVGCAMLAFVAAGPWILRSFGYGVFIPALIASGFLTIAATQLCVAAPIRIGLLIVLGFALAMRLLLVGEEPFLSTDLYRYIWDGRVQAAGINPYAYVPADPALAALRDAAIYPHINRADYAVTAYPPLAEMFFFLVTRIGETLTVMRLPMLACEAVIVALLIDLLRRLDRPAVSVAAYAWHPLATWEIANNGHVEALMVALMLLGVWLLVRARHVAGAVAVALAMLVKPYALFILPSFWRRGDWRVPLAVIATIVLCYLPYLGAGKSVFGFLGSGYLAEEGLTSGEGIWLTLLIQTLIGKIPGLTAAYVLIAAAIMIWLALRVVLRPDATPRDTVADIILLLTAGLVLMSPNYAWYFLALAPFIPLGAGASAWALTLGAFLLYRPIFIPFNDLAWKTLATLPFLIALGFIWRRRARAPQPGPRPSQPVGDKAIVSVVIPCLNEEDAIPGVAREVLAQGADEVIVVDNGSTDATAACAREAGAHVVSEPQRGYGRACAAGVRAARADADIVCFLDGDGSDVPSYFADVVGPVARGEADFVMGSRLRGQREPGSMTPQQLVAGRLAGLLMRLVYGVRFTDMSPFRAIHLAQLRSLGMSEQTYGWNLEMQMRVAAGGLRIREVPVDHRCRRGGVSKVSGNLVAGLSAALKIAATFVRLAITLRRPSAAPARERAEAR